MPVLFLDGYHESAIFVTRPKLPDSDDMGQNSDDMGQILAVKAHFETASPEERRRTCAMCMETFDSRNQLFEHLATCGGTCGTIQSRKAAQTTPSVLTMSDHPHELHYSQSLRHHCCDLCDTDIKKPHDGYRCSDGCDFDVCMKCAKAYIKEAEDDEEDDDEDEEEEEEQQAMKYGGDLCMIADLGDASKVQTFLSVSNVQTFINYQDTDGHTPLFKAAKKGHAAVVDQLIAARCNVDLANTDDGQTPLFIAAEQGHTPVVEQLIAARCSLNLVSAVRRLYYREREKCLCIHMRVIGGGGTGGERVYTLHLKPSPPHAKH